MTKEKKESTNFKNYGKLNKIHLSVVPDEFLQVLTDF